MVWQSQVYDKGLLEDRADLIYALKAQNDEKEAAHVSPKQNYANS